MNYNYNYQYPQQQFPPVPQQQPGTYVPYPPPSCNSYGFGQQPPQQPPSYQPPYEMKQFPVSSPLPPPPSQLAPYQANSSVPNSWHQGNYYPDALWLSTLRRPPQEEIVSAEYAFARADLDRSGTIDSEELKRVLYDLGEDWSANNVDMMIRMFDRDNNRTINYYEFQDLWAFLSEMKTAFRSYHQNNYISLYNAENALARSIFGAVNAYAPMRGATDIGGFNNIVNMLFRMFDRNGTGQLSQQTFLKLALQLAQILTAFQHQLGVGGPMGNLGTMGNLVSHTAPQQNMGPFSSGSTVGNLINLASMAMKRETSDERNMDMSSPSRGVQMGQGDCNFEDFAQNWLNSHQIEQ